MTENLICIPTTPLNNDIDCGFCYTIILNSNYAAEAKNYILCSKYLDPEKDKTVCLKPFEKIEYYSKVGDLLCVVNHVEMKYDYQSEEGTINFSDLFTLPPWYMIKGGKIRLYRNSQQFKVEDLCVFVNSCMLSPEIGKYSYIRDEIQSAERQNLLELGGEVIDFRCFRQNQDSSQNEFWYKSIPIKNCRVNGVYKDWKNMYMMLLHVKYSYVKQLYFEFDDDFENPEKYQLYIVTRN